MATRPRTEALIAAALWLVAGAAPAEAQPAPAAAPPDHPDDLEEAFRLYEQGKYLEAARLWEQALAIAGEEKGWRLHYNLGLAYQAAADATAAVEHYESFIRRVAAETAALPPELEERREDAAARVRALQKANGAVSLPRSQEGVTVRIDGGTARPAGFTAYLPPGHHVLEVTGPTGAVRRWEVDVRAGEPANVDTSDPAPPPAPPPPAPPTVIVKPVEEPPSYPIALVLVGVGVTGLGFILPGVLYDKAADQRATADELGPGHTGYADALDEFESARTAYQISYVLPAALGVATAGIAIWGAVHVASWEPADASVSAAVVPGGGAFWVRGSF
jgi:tetratricopeptide (TPR) repeat protein